MVVVEKRVVPCAVARDRETRVVLCKLAEDMYFELYDNGRGGETARFYASLPYRGVQFDTVAKVALCRDGEIVAVAGDFSARVYFGNGVRHGEVLDFLPPPDTEGFEDIVRDEYGEDAERLIEIARACWSALK